MALTSLQTNLKSLNYPTAREKGAPLMTRVDGFTPLNQGANPIFQGGNTILGDIELISHTNDSVDATVRGGLKIFGERLKIDLSRMTKFLGDPIRTPFEPNMGGTLQGYQFFQRQLGLQLMNPKVSAPMGGLIDSAPANNRTFNPASILTQISVAGTGVHIKREGLIPFNNRGYIGNTRFAKSLAEDPTGDIVGALTRPKKFDDNIPNKDNRLLFLYDEKLGAAGTYRDAVSPHAEMFNPETKFGQAVEWVNDVSDSIGGAISKVLNVIGGKGEPLYDYWGGPGSLFGVGRTFIGRYVNTTVDNEGNRFPTVKPLEQGHIEKYGQNTNKVKNYLQSLGRMNATDYSETREDRYGLGHPGSRFGSGKYKEKYNPNPLLADHTAQDKINMYPLVRGTDNQYEHEFDGKPPKDFIKFRFEAIDTLRPNRADLIIFRAFLESFGDSYTANHNSYKYNGRGEEFYTYNGFSRDISISFKIAAQTREEMKPLYHKLNYLASNIAPEYSALGRMRTPFIRLSVGDYIDRTPGILTSLSITWQKDYPWEINHEEDDSIHILPHVLDVSTKFIPIHEFLPKKSVNDSPFIGIKNWMDDPIFETVYGCMDKQANNYNEEATIHTSDCEYDTVDELYTEEEWNTVA